MDVQALEPALLGRGGLVLAGGLFVRILVTRLALLRSGLTVRARARVRVRVIVRVRVRVRVRVSLATPLGPDGVRG